MSPTTIFRICVVKALLLGACDSGWLGEPVTLDDKIVNWNQGDAGYTMTATTSEQGAVLAMVPVEPNGHFVLPLPDGGVMGPLLVNYSVPKGGSNCRGVVTANPPDAKTSLLSLSVSSGTGTPMRVDEMGDPAMSSYVSAAYYYFDRATAVTGTIDCTHDYFFFTTTDTTHYDLHFRPGWNIVANRTDVAPAPANAHFRTHP